MSSEPPTYHTHPAAAWLSRSRDCRLPGLILLRPSALITQHARTHTLTHANAQPCHDSESLAKCFTATVFIPNVLSLRFPSDSQKGAKVEFLKCSIFKLLSKYVSGSFCYWSMWFAGSGGCKGPIIFFPEAAVLCAFTGLHYVCKPAVNKHSLDTKAG